MADVVAGVVEPIVPMSRSTGWRRVADVVALMKPRIALMALITAAGTWLLARPMVSLGDAPAFVAAMVGIGLVVMGAGALNMWLERDVDALMERTRDRPLPTGRLDPLVALLLGMALVCIAIAMLVMTVNVLTAVVAGLSVVSYVLVYTPMKRTSAWALVVGAFPGAAPALMGGTAAAGMFERHGVALFVVVLLWQLPHFLAISVYRRDEYAAAGHIIAPQAVGMTSTRQLLLATAVMTAAAGVALWPLQVASPVFAVVALILGLWFIAVCAQGLRAFPNRGLEDAWARRSFVASLVYQTALFGALGIDVVITRWMS
jgi:heme o synthase